MSDISIQSPARRIRYTDRILLVGSCFTEHIGGKLANLKFETLQNPHGILFDPVSVCDSLVSYLEARQYQAGDLFYYQELWQSWAHHSRFSGTDQQMVLQAINDSQNRAHDFLQSADWLIITLGSSYSYRLVENQQAVANCHRAPGQWFRKHLCTIDETVAALDNMMHRLFKFNPHINLVFTISPVRHLRDGIIENSRSKARLIEAVHHMVDKFDRLHYFPAFELMIDVLRDYRFYDIDLAHPNYLGTEFVLEKFKESFIDPEAHGLMDQVQQILNARKHKAFQPDTTAHRNFLEQSAQKTRRLMETHPFLNLNEELAYFEDASTG